MRTVFTPTSLKALKDLIVPSDNYPSHDPDIQVLGYQTTGGTLEPHIIANDSTLFEFIRRNAGSAGLVVGEPRYISDHGFRRSDSFAYVVPSHVPFFNIGNGDPLKGHDSSYLTRFSFAFNAGDFHFLSSSSTVIAYVTVWRRIHDRQGKDWNDCRCALYDSLMTFEITRGMFDTAERAREPLEQFKEVGFWLDARDSTGRGYLESWDNQRYLSRIGATFGGVNVAPCTMSCSDLRDSLITAGLISTSSQLRSDAVVGSDIYYDFYSTGQARIEFLRGRVATHEFEALMNHRLGGVIEADIAALLDPDPADTSRIAIRDRIFRISAYDEPNGLEGEANAYLADTLQDLIDTYSADPRLGLFQNPVQNYDGFRRLQFDLDPTKPKRVHMMARQTLAPIQSPIPVFYIRPDKMIRTGLDTVGWKKFYPPTGLNRLVAFNTSADYDTFTTRQQASYGKFRDYPTIVTHGPIIPMLARIVDVAKFKYRAQMPDSVPVYNVITSYGWLNGPGSRDANGYTGIWGDGIRVKTPEEIAVQCFISLQCGAQGIEFDELAWNGVNLGIADHRIGVARVNWADSCGSWEDSGRLGLTWSPCDRGEWDTAWSNHTNNRIPNGIDSIPDPKWILPQMWTGFRSRFLAVKRIVEEMRRIAPVYQRLYYKQEQISVHDQSQEFSEIPMLADFRMEKADTSVRSSIVPYGSIRCDTREETYAEITHLYPGERDGYNASRGSRYLAILNRRTWPIDHAYYGSQTTSLDSASALRGFGFIDVRRPRITLKSATMVPADSFLVEKIGYEDSLSWTVAAGEELVLDWLEPGWGGLYRVTPVSKGISEHGVAYNNGVRAIATDSGVGSGHRFVVYERDSAIFVREFSDGTWRGEKLISSPTDVEQGRFPEGVFRVGSNMHPSLAMTGDQLYGDQYYGKSQLIVWERRDPSTGVASVEAAYRPWYDTSYSLVTLRGYASLPSGFTLAPVAVGLDSGFVVAWASPETKGIHLAFLRESNLTLSDSMFDAADVTELTYALDSTSQFPALAYDGRQHPHAQPHKAVHLAYQQGPIGGATRIMYQQLRVRSDLGDFATGIPAKYATEEVTKGLRACAFRMPSIASDSIRTGVTFEIHGSGRSIGLRFRDSMPSPPGGAVGVWETALYKWGGYDPVGNRYYPISFQREYSNPSVVQFPAMTRQFLTSNHVGALTWQWTNSSSRKNGIFVYRYGDKAPVTTLDGAYPTMIQAPFDNLDPFASSGLIVRGSLLARFEAPQPGFPPSFYFPLRAENTPASPSELFTEYNGGPSGIYSHFTVAKAGIAAGITQGCTELWPKLSAGVVTPKLPTAMVVPKTPMTPASFFKRPGLGQTIADSITTVVDISRTSDFFVDSSAVTVRRIVAGSDSLFSWLNQHYDSLNAKPADIGIVTELVRISNGSVLWHDDTLWARDFKSATLDDQVTVPVHTVASPGVLVYVRVRPVISTGLVYDFDAGFAFIQDSIQQSLSRGKRTKDAASPEARTALSVTARPNPSEGTVRLRIGSVEAGDAAVTVHDLLGTLILPSRIVRVTTAGEVEIDLDLGELRPGTYSVRAQVGRNVASTLVTIVR